MADRIVVHARRSDKPWPPPVRPPREHVRANVIDEVRRIGIDGWCRIHAPDLDEVLHDRGPYFYDVCFRIADVKRLWKAASKSRSKPPPWAALLKWWSFEYVKKYPDPDKRPAVAEQHEAAKAQFPNHAPPTFDQMKKLRADPSTPGEWREGGRRPKSG
jgi:hypothetical protein